MTFWNEGTFTLTWPVQDLPVILKWHNFQSLKKALNRCKKCNRRPIITSVQCTYLNIFFSETSRLIELKFYMEYALEKKTIYYILFQVTWPKWAPCPYIVKTF